jgi:hypothetical protein
MKRRALKFIARPIRRKLAKASEATAPGNGKPLIVS